MSDYNPVNKTWNMICADPLKLTLTTLCFRHLYNKLKESNMVNMVGLTDPSSISVGVGDSDHKSRMLAARLQNLPSDQVLLVPYNSG